MSVARSLIILLLFSPSCLLLPHHPPPSPHAHFNMLLTVKTTRGNHGTRLKQAMETWAKMEYRPEGVRIFFVSDGPFPSSGQFEIIDSGCPVGHDDEGLCCKMAVELQLALDQQPDFWCHFDDDSFVILPNLLAHLRQFPAHLDLYIGHASTSAPISLAIGTNKTNDDPIIGQQFWFGTGGAGFCLSSSTVGKLRSFVRDDHFKTLCAQLGVPDDVTLGFVLNNLLDIRLTRSELFHSHLEKLGSIPRAILAQQISLSGSLEGRNFVAVPTTLPYSQDPLRFHSLQRFINANSKNRKILIMEGKRKRKGPRD